MRLFLLTLIFMWCTAVWAEVYRFVDDEGVVHYSDSKKEGAEKITIDKYTPKNPSSQLKPKLQDQKTKEVPPKPTGEPGFPGYSKFELTSPKDDEVVRSNSGELNVRLTLTPSLFFRKGHKIELYMDSKKVFSGSTTVIPLKNVDRGTHSLRAEIIDPANGNVLATTPLISFHLKRFSALF
ncbi:MAG: DUF4124 domain-containing protein [Gammaproteobacteria bacterium]|nr:DUF4124 domain-containing protein [Gammaproteobacteria bacterium]